MLVTEKGEDPDITLLTLFLQKIEFFTERERTILFQIIEAIYLPRHEIKVMLGGPKDKWLNLDKKEENEKHS